MDCVTTKLPSLLLICFMSLSSNSIGASVLSFSEEFDVEQPDNVSWEHYQVGQKFDGFNVDSAVSIDNGVLSISSVQSESGSLTGAISFKPSFTVQGGYLEIRAKFPTLGKGKQCSISLKSPLFGNSGIDEQLTAEKTGSIVTLARFASSWGGDVSTDIVWGNWGDKKQLLKSKAPYKLDDGEFHTFGIELMEESYNIYLNGKKYWKASEGISGVPLYLVINCEIKASLGEFDGKVTDAPFEIDYVRYYEEYDPVPVEPSGMPVTNQEWDIRKGEENIDFGDFRDDPLFIPSQPGDFEAIRVTLRKGEHLGTDAVFDFPSSNSEAWVEYCLLLSDSWQAKTAGKLPGFSADSGRWFGGQGGHPSTGKNAWSARMLYGEYEPDTRSVPVGQYIYHTDQGEISKYGDPDWWSLTEDRLVSDSARLKNNHWVSIKQHLKVNSDEENDGLIEGWLDDELVYRRDDLNFSNSWLHRKITRFWMDIYYGGEAVAESDQVLYIDQVNYSLGAEDKTSSHCQ